MIGGRASVTTDASASARPAAIRSRTRMRHMLPSCTPPRPGGGRDGTHRRPPSGRATSRRATARWRWAPAPSRAPSRSSPASRRAGTNPEELIGAAEAGCFTMQLSHALSEAGHAAGVLHTDAKVHIRNVDGARRSRGSISPCAAASRPRRGDVQGDRRPGDARACIISRALGGVDEITVDAALET